MTSFTLLLTRGTHVISAGDACAVRDAIERSDKLVEIELDPFGGVESGRRTAIAVRHIVALTRNEPQPAAHNVTTLAGGAVVTRSGAASGRRER